MPHDYGMRSIYEYVTSNLRDREPEWKDAARHAGVHRKTVARIISGAVGNPGVLTIEKLADYVRKNRHRFQ